MIERNVRLPGRVLGDIRSPSSRRARSPRAAWPIWSARYGADGVAALMVAMMDYSERLTRHCLAELPDGEATFTDWIDDDQIDAGVPIPLVCTVRKHGDTMEVDWTGSAPQVKGAINNTWSYTAAMSFTAVKSVLSINMPNNDGVFRPIKVIAPAGTITHGKLPAACAARGLTGFRGVDCCFGALAQLYPDRVYGGLGRRQHRPDDRRLRQGRCNPFIYVDFMSGAWGGAALGGRAGRQHLHVRQHGELLGRGDRGGEPAGSAGLRIRAGHRRRGQIPRRHGAAQDLADAGRRGDPAGARRPPDASAVRAARRRARRVRAATCSIPGLPTEATLHAKLTMTLRRGQMFRHELPGAGGWGDRAGRAISTLVAKDLRDGLVTIEAAARDYGVVAAGDPPEIDVARDRGAARRGLRRRTKAVARRGVGAGGMSLRIGIDIGGTFTDLVAIDGDGRVTTHKTASTPHDYGEGIIEGLRALLADRRGTVTDVLHATTVGSNTVLEGKGARTALITTRGFRDILEIRDLRMPVLYDIALDQAARAGGTPPAPGSDREAAAGRFGRGAARPGQRGCRRSPCCARRTCQSVAICLLHSYANPAHERAVARARCARRCRTSRFRSAARSCRRSRNIRAPARP